MALTLHILNSLRKDGIRLRQGVCMTSMDSKVPGLTCTSSHFPPLWSLPGVEFSVYGQLTRIGDGGCLDGAPPISASYCSCSRRAMSSSEAVGWCIGVDTWLEDLEGPAGQQILICSDERRWLPITIGPDFAHNMGPVNGYNAIFPAPDIFCTLLVQKWYCRKRRVQYCS